MKLKAKRDFNHAGRQHKQGDEFEVPDHEAKQLIDGGHAEAHPEGQKSGAPSQQQQAGAKPPDR
jgi:hypothetical protein